MAGCAWQGVHDRGCMTGGMHGGGEGACVAGGVQGRGACMTEGHMWQGVGMWQAGQGHE